MPASTSGRSGSRPRSRSLDTETSTAIGGGGQIASRKALLVPHGLVAACSGAKIRVYSAVSGELLFEMEGHTDEVTDLTLAGDRLFSCSKDGHIKRWNLDSGTCVSSWELPERRPMESVAVVGDTAYVSFFWRGEDAGRILAFDLAEGRANEVRVKLSTPRPVVCSSSGGEKQRESSSESKESATTTNSSIVATHDRHTVLVWDLAQSPQVGKKKALRLHHTKAFTCVAVSPDGSRVAAGDVTGRILIWHDLKQGIEAALKGDVGGRTRREAGDADDALGEDIEFVEYTEPPAASVHWHAHAVGCLSFSADGRYLLSGGEEAVLVLWDVRTSGRAYLPRLGGPLTGIAPSPEDPAKYCLRQSDNTLRVVNIASMMIECSIHGMRPVPRGGCAAAITFEGRHGHAVVVGDHSVLQFFDVSKDSHVDRLQLSRRNIVSMSGEDDHGVVVEAVAFDETASLLVSVETSGDNQLLKFWDRSPDETQQYGVPYMLNTLAENPHRTTSGNHAVTGVAVAPVVSSGSRGSSKRFSTTNLVATCSTSGDFALWETYRGAAEVSHRDRSMPTWRKMAVVPGHHGDPLTAVAFSSDGSLVAVANVGGALSLWDTASCAFVGELPSAFPARDGEYIPPSSSSSSPSPSSPASLLRNPKVFFIPESPIVVYVCAFGIAVYDVLSLSVVWSAELDGICSVANDPASNHWAIVTSANHVLLFEGDSNRPKMGWSIRQRQTSSPKPPTLNPATVGGGAESFKAAKSTSPAKAPVRVALPEIAFVPRGTTTYNAARPTSIPGCSPLVVFSPDREFMSVVRESAMGPRRKTAGDTHGSSDVFDNASGYRAIFGSGSRSNRGRDDHHSDDVDMVTAPGEAGFSFGESIGQSVDQLALDFLSSLLD